MAKEKIVYDPSKVTKVGKSYDGYLEKKSNSQLDSKTANAGSNNWTRFGRDYDKIMGTKLNGQSWCAMFLCIIFVEAFGLKVAKKLLGGNLFAYTPSGATQMDATKRKPKIGDVVFFYNATMKRIAHVGYVYDVDSKYFYTIEGNTSSDPGVVRNGGSVNMKKYAISKDNAYFATPGEKANIDTKQSDVKTADNGNPYTCPSSDTVLKKGSKGNDVKWVQFELNQDKASLVVDGDFGSNTKAAVESYQKRHGLKVDGIVGSKTIASLKGDNK